MGEYVIREAVQTTQIIYIFMGRKNEIKLDREWVSWGGIKNK